MSIHKLGSAGVNPPAYASRGNTQRPEALPPTQSAIAEPPPPSFGQSAKLSLQDLAETTTTSPAGSGSEAETSGGSQLSETIDSLNRYLQSVDQGLEFEIDEGSGKAVVRIVAKATGEVIRQIPPEEILAVSRALAEGAGAMLDGTA